MEIEDRADLPRIAAHGRRRFVDVGRDTRYRSLSETSFGARSPISE
jgi:hypothetical protein